VAEEGSPYPVIPEAALTLLSFYRYNGIKSDKWRGLADGKFG